MGANAGAVSGVGEKVYFPHLDGLRFWAFFTVFLSHSLDTTNTALTHTPDYEALHPWFKSGVLGVNFFFVLSGFLITYLLLVEHDRRGRIDIRAFYIRRALRIWPLYFAVVAVTYAVQPGFPADARLPHIACYLSFTPNFALLQSTLQAGPQAAYSGQMTVLWSVGVEEQFYLLWPLLMTAALLSAARLITQKARGWVGPPLLFGLVCALSLGFRVAWRDSPPTLYLHTLSVIGDMALGGWVGWKGFTDPGWRARLADLSRASIVAGYITLVIAVAAFVLASRFSWVNVLARPVLAALFAFVIVEQCYARNSFYKSGHSRWMSRLGTYTYGLYCLHEFAITMVQKVVLWAGLDKYLWQLLGIQIPLTLALSIVLAVLSYHLFESPFLRLKHRFTRVPTH